MADKLMIHKITPSIDYNYWLRRLITQLYESVLRQTQESQTSEWTNAEVDT